MPQSGDQIGIQPGGQQFSGVPQPQGGILIGDLEAAARHEQTCHQGGEGGAADEHHRQGGGDVGPTQSQAGQSQAGQGQQRWGHQQAVANTRSHRVKIRPKLREGLLW